MQLVEHRHHRHPRKLDFQNCGTMSIWMLTALTWTLDNGQLDSHLNAELYLSNSTDCVPVVTAFRDLFLRLSQGEMTW